MYSWKTKTFLVAIAMVGTVAFFGVNIIIAFAAVEDVDEMMTRKDRRLTNSFPSTVLESSSPYVWQPETFQYHDIQTGNEVWKISSTPGKLSQFNNDLGINPWSADGNRVSFSTFRDTKAFSGTDQQIWMVAKTDGSFLRTPINTPKRSASNRNLLWSPILADTYYQFGDDHYLQSTGIPGTLYKVIVGDSSENRTPLLSNFPTNLGVYIDIVSASSDGKRVMVRNSVPTYSGQSALLYPTIVYPDANAEIEVPNGYPYFRDSGMSRFINTPSFFMTSHGDGYVLSNPTGEWFFSDPSGGSCEWKYKTIGSAADGGPLWTDDTILPIDQPPYDFGEVIPQGRCTPNPLNRMDVSHGANDQWGHYQIFSNVNANPLGSGIYDVINNSLLVNTFGGGAQHNSWYGWSDWAITTRGPGGDTSPSCTVRPELFSNDRIYTEKYDDASSRKTVAYTHTLFNNSGCYNGAGNEYPAIPRPLQSPDGTKVAFHSTFLNPKVTSYDNRPDLFYAVAYYPYPAQIQDASKNGSNVRIAWDFNQGTAQNPNHTDPRTYTKRGWPDEASDRSAAPREIKNFRIWTSDDGSTWTPTGTTTYNNCTATNECGKWTETSWNFDYEQPNNSTKYYALTSVEHSGLESRTLSNVWKVTLDTNGNITENSQQTAYPSDPGGKTNFFQTKPDAPQNISSTHKLAPANADGQYTLTWNAPINKTLIRYYNIYAHDGSIPTPTQQMRIASIAATSDYTDSGNYKYIDWLGSTDGSTQYLVTSVDFQGNESLVSGDAVAPAAPSGLLVQ